MNTNATKSTLSIDDADASQRKSSSSKSSALPTKSTHQHHDVAVATEEKAKTEGTKVGANYVARAFPKNDNDSKKKEPKYVRE